MAPPNRLSPMERCERYLSQHIGELERDLVALDQNLGAVGRRAFWSHYAQISTALALVKLHLSIPYLASAVAGTRREETTRTVPRAGRL